MSCWPYHNGRGRARRSLKRGNYRIKATSFLQKLHLWRDILAPQFAELPSIKLNLVHVCSLWRLLCIRASVYDGTPHLEPKLQIGSHSRHYRATLLPPFPFIAIKSALYNRAISRPSATPSVPFPPLKKELLRGRQRERDLYRHLVLVLQPPNPTQPEASQPFSSS